jgi:hypothetical protein
VTLFSLEAYGRVCGVVEAIRRHIGGDDLSDADAFPNWIYQTKVRNTAAIGRAYPPEFERTESNIAF